jgi:hypothetical protein
VARVERQERRDDLARRVAHRAIAADDVRVEVREPDLAPVEQPRIMEIEEDRAASQEGLDVPAEPPDRRHA